MDTYTQKFKEFLDEKKIEYSLKIFAKPVNTSERCAEELGNIEQVVKTILLIDPENNLYAAILRGSDSLQRKKIKKQYGVKDLTILPFDEVEKRVGYPAGGVPPFGYSAKFMIDSSLQHDEIVYAGGGSIYSLVEITIESIKRVTQAEVFQFTK